MIGFSSISVVRTPPSSSSLFPLSFELGQLVLSVVEFFSPLYQGGGMVGTGRKTSISSLVRGSRGTSVNLTPHIMSRVCKGREEPFSVIHIELVNTEGKTLIMSVYGMGEGGRKRV
ncbi:hypothetical protein P175DRAFT_0155446 [Aspergillus ochraceoroseus IBT 24754]|uniref:Uncharacterized protein n=1 Tax=Aspergillus ochraceoroseus IBT 24754 TaxID=1392256 RepID=A0A2T5M3D0_9EURO|nr:uncharacterized protein P175DRAFT_0155446 [Aspergillus ochraceoroseus IBT 24754]PTU23033.1 hypothetical protein P175DRAFT_0155446 [Aspergillus ochraceoroseus IBT 24754]